MGRKHWLLVVALAIVVAAVAFFWPKPIKGEARRAAEVQPILRHVGFFPPGTRPDRMAAMIRDALSAS